MKTCLPATALALLMLTLAFGCVTSKDLGKIQLGQTKAEVIAKLGPPHTVAAQRSEEFLTYWLDRENMGGEAEYYIKLVDGKVESFGHKGGFGTTVFPKERIELDIKHK